MKTCSIDGCDKPVRIQKHQLCHAHCNKLYKYGDPLATGYTTEEQRFWMKVDAEGDCWQWTASDIRGYGQFKSKSGSPLAHRWAYEHLVGPIPADMTLDHLCRNTGCVNPDHLEVTSIRTNILRSSGPAAANARKTTCPQGHDYDRMEKRPAGRDARTCRTCKAAGRKSREKR